VSELNYFAVGCVVQDALLLIQLQQTSRMAEFGPTTFGSSSRNLHTSQMRQHDQSAQYKYLELLYSHSVREGISLAADTHVKGPLSMVATAFSSWGWRKHTRELGEEEEGSFPASEVEMQPPRHPS
jgi:hypothetical protein